MVSKQISYIGPFLWHDNYAERDNEKGNLSVYLSVTNDQYCIEVHGYNHACTICLTVLTQHLRWQTKTSICFSVAIVLFIRPYENDSTPIPVVGLQLNVEPVYVNGW